MNSCKTSKNAVYPRFCLHCYRFFLWLYLRAREDRCALKAASLTFYSLLSIVPVLAVFFGIAKGFGFEESLQQTLRQEFYEQKEVLEHLINFGYSTLQETQGGLIAGVGVAVLLFTVIRLFDLIEDCLNTMWGADKGRTYLRKISDYLALILICPLFFVISSSLTVYVVSQVKQATLSNQLLNHISPALFVLLKKAPYFLSSLLFGFLYIAMPNTKVLTLPALYAGLLAGSAYQILQAFYIDFQIAVTKTSAIYGSFAALPLFLTWLYLSWMIFLLGAEVLVLIQEKLWNISPFEDSNHISSYEKRIACIAITSICLKAFLSQNPVVTISYIASSLNLPIRMAIRISRKLIKAKIICKVETDQDWAGALILAQDPHELKIYDVARTIEGANREIHSLRYPGLIHIDHALQALEKQTATQPQNILIKNLPF